MDPSISSQGENHDLNSRTYRITFTIQANLHWNAIATSIDPRKTCQSSPFAKTPWTTIEFELELLSTCQEVAISLRPSLPPGNLSERSSSQFAHQKWLMICDGGSSTRSTPLYAYNSSRWQTERKQVLQFRDLNVQFFFQVRFSVRLDLAMTGTRAVFSESDICTKYGCAFARKGLHIPVPVPVGIVGHVVISVAMRLVRKFVVLIRCTVGNIGPVIRLI